MRSATACRATGSRRGTCGVVAAISSSAKRLPTVLVPLGRYSHGVTVTGRKEIVVDKAHPFTRELCFASRLTRLLSTHSRSRGEDHGDASAVMALNAPCALNPGSTRVGTQNIPVEAGTPTACLATLGDECDDAVHAAQCHPTGG